MAYTGTSHYQIPIDSIPLNVAVYRYAGDDFVFIDFNKQAEKTEKIKKEDIIGKKLCDIFPSAKEFGIFERLMNVYVQGKNETFEISRYEDDRISGWRKNELIKLPNGDVMAIYDDLTKAKHLEEENASYLLKLQESEEKFKNIAENVLMGIFIYGDHYLYVNDAFSSMLGYTKDELYEMNIWEVVEKSDQEKVKEAAMRRLKGEQFSLTYADIKLVTKSGQIKTMRVSTRTITYNGHFAGMGTMIDITDIKETKEQLKILAQAIEQTDDLVRIVDTKGVILFVNNSVITHSGYSRSELIGAHTRIFKSGRHDTAFYNQLWNTVRSGKIYRETFVNRKKDGTFLYEEETITPILDENGNIEYYVSTSKDVSQRVELENALRESEINFRNIFNKSSDGIVIHDLEGNLLEVNAIICERLGYEKEELIGKNITFIDAPEAYKNIPEAMQLLLQNGHVMIEREHLRKDGGSMPVEIHATLIDYMHNRAILSVVRDITERKSSEKALRDAEELYHTMFDISPVGILIVDPNTGQAVEFNRIAHEKLGYTAEEFAAMHINDYEMHESEADTKAHIEALKQGNAEVFETQHRAKNGEVLDVIVSVQLIEIKGKPYLFSVFHDITSLKQYEQTLKTLSLRLTLATKAASIGVWEWDLKSNTLQWDNQMYALYGIEKYTHEEPYTTWRNAVDLNDIDKAEASLQTAIRGEGDYNVQFWITTPHNERRFIQAMGTAERDNTGEITRIVGVNWDITRQKEYEKVLEIAKQSAESANSAKSNFLANMSHEIRTPMNAILGMIQLTHSLDLPPEAEEYLKKIEKSSKILLHIINDILDFSKIEANRLEITPTSFDLNETIEQTSTLFAPKADAKGLEFVVRVASNIPNKLIGDSLRVSQILNNLVSNAVKFTHSGEIEISISSKQLSEQNITISFAIRDTGIGISAKDQHKLFTMFSQADESITRKYGGTGLGLSISKRLAELMGGSLDFTSEEGHGSTFTFTAEFAIEENNSYFFTESPMQKGLDVLVIDDQKSARDILKEILTTWNCHVDESKNGENALKKILKRVQNGNPYDLIIVDWSMPGLNGIETIRAIRDIEKEQQKQDIHIVMMVTAYSKDIVLNTIQDEEIVDVFLNKPVTYSSVFDALSNKALHTKLRPAVSNAHEDLRSMSRLIRGATVLLVEDNEINIQVESAFLQQMGVHVTVVTDGLQAVQLLDKKDFDGILMDYQMPVMDGIEATEVIRQRGNDTPIIAMTAAAMQRDKEACLRAGMNDYLSKPIDIVKMAQVLTKWIAPRMQENKLFKNVVPISNPMVLPSTIQGIDLNMGLNNSAGNSELYHRILTQFYHQYAQGCKPLKELLQNGKFLDAQRWIHTLKGVSATIGAVTLNDLAIRIETALIHKKETDLGEFCRILSEISEGLKSLAKGTISHPTEHNYPIAIEQLSRIEAKLRRSQLVEPEEVAVLEEALGRFSNLSHCKILKEALEIFDYEKAQDAVTALQTMIEEEYERTNR